MKLKILASLAFIFLAFETASPDEQIFLQKIKTLPTGKVLSERCLAAGKSFLGTPYAYNTLEINDLEQLVVNFRQLDCWTLVENCTAFGLTAKEPSPDFETFKNHLQNLRYWGGTVDGYGSRIHYFSGWILQQEKRGILRDVTQEIGGKPYRKTVNYLSAHRESNPQLADNQTFKDIQNAEARINSHDWFFVPKSKIAAIEHLIQEGDLVATTSSRPDLDISHQGFAVRKNGRVHLMHASSEFKKVVVSAWPLSKYLARNKGQSGIMVLRFRNV